MHHGHYDRWYLKRGTQKSVNKMIENIEYKIKVNLLLSDDSPKDQYVSNKIIESPDFLTINVPSNAQYGSKEESRYF